MSDTSEVLRVAAGFGLPGVAGPSSDGPPVLTRGDIEMATSNRIEGLLWAALEAGAIVADVEHLAQARGALLGALSNSLMAESIALRAFEALDTAGIEARALKGVAISHLDHRDPAERVFGDADLLIRRSDYRLGLSTLEKAGFRRAAPPVRRWWERRFGKAIMMNAPNDGELDLHLAIAGGYFGERIDHDRLWASASVPFDLGGRATRGLDPAGRLLQACCHVVVGGGSGLRGKRDVAQLVLVSGTDWQTMVANAQLDHVDAVPAQAVRLTWAELRLDSEHPIARWAADHEDDPVQQRALADSQGSPDRGWAPEGRSTLNALRRMDRVRFLAGLAIPSRASMRHRGRTWREHLRLGITTMRGGS